jgi:hypothetical protein
MIGVANVNASPVVGRRYLHSKLSGLSGSSGVLVLRKHARPGLYWARASQKAPKPSGTSPGGGPRLASLGLASPAGAAPASAGPTAGSLPASVPKAALSSLESIGESSACDAPAGGRWEAGCWAEQPLCVLGIARFTAPRPWTAGEQEGCDDDDRGAPAGEGSRRQPLGKRRGMGSQWTPRAGGDDTSWLRVNPGLSAT